jgi:hypothetical protein
MAEEIRVFSSIIDEILDDRQPNFEELDLEGAVESGEEQLNRTHQYVDTIFEDEIEESATSHHTPVWGPHTSSAPSREQANRNQRLEIARAAAQEKQRAKEARERGSMGGPTTTSRIARQESDFINDIADNESVQREKLMNPGKARNTAEDMYKKSISDASVARYVTTLLEQGHAPSKIAAVLFKLAEGAPFFNRQMSQEYLNQMSGLLGFKNLEPNHFMPKQPESYERVKTKVGEWGGELRSVLNRMTAGVPKGHKQAAFTRKVQRLVEAKIASDQRKKSAAEQTQGAIVRLEQIQNANTFRQSSIAAVQDKHNRKVAAKEKKIEVTAATIEALHKKGHPIEKIYNAAARKVGSVQAGNAVKMFIAGLKRSGAKVALSQIDCTFLKQKLGVQNAIVGAPKCASCVYRQGMHCGLTGGTLLSFPGMERTSSNHKIADGAPKDGHAMLAEYEMNTGFPLSAGDIDIKESSGLLDVEPGNITGGMNFE